MKKIIFTLTLSVFMLFFVGKLNALAGPYDGQLVPCGPLEPCTMCHFVKLGQNIFDLFFKVSLGFSILFLIISGIIYIVSAGNEGMMTKAKDSLKYTFIGFFVTLIAWVLTNTIARVFNYNTSGSWYNLELVCVQTIGTGQMSLYTDDFGNEIPKKNEAGEETGGFSNVDATECEEASPEEKEEVKKLCEQLLTYVNGQYDTTGIDWDGQHTIDNIKQCAGQGSTDSGCYEAGHTPINVPVKSVMPSKYMLQQLLLLLEDEDVKGVKIGAFGGGKHSTTSGHFRGHKVDISHIYFKDSRNEFTNSKKNYDGDIVRNYLKEKEYFSDCYSMYGHNDPTNKKRHQTHADVDCGGAK